MALPGITLPHDFPAWSTDNHGAELDPAYASVAMQAGHTRLRRIYTTAPQVHSVALLLEKDQAQRFHAWFEDDLLAGARSFAAQVKAFGPGLHWWTARFVAPYKAEPLATPAGPDWRITAQLLLTGAPQAEGPVLNELSASIRIPLSAAAAMAVEPRLSASIRVPLGGYVRGSGDTLRASIVVPLQGLADLQEQYTVVVGGDPVRVGGFQVVARA